MERKVFRLRGNTPFVTLKEKLKRVCNSEMAIGEFDLGPGIVDC
jgi:hypothetical protein